MQDIPEKLPDWAKFVLYALLIPGLGALWIWVIRPFLASFVWHLMEQKPEKQVELFFKAIEDEKQQPRLVKVSQKIFGDRITHVDTEIERAVGIGSRALTLAEGNRDAMEFLKSSILQQGQEIQRISEIVGGVPQLAIAVQRVKDAVQRIEDSAGANRELLARIEERQIAIANMVERRDGTFRDTGERRRQDDRG
jgi:hypothetical protein